MISFFFYFNIRIFQHHTQPSPLTIYIIFLFLCVSSLIPNYVTRSRFLFNHHPRSASKSSNFCYHGNSNYIFYICMLFSHSLSTHYNQTGSSEEWTKNSNSNGSKKSICINSRQIFSHFSVSESVRWWGAGWK